jgi:polysaccharide export outer membrane protein
MSKGATYGAAALLAAMLVQPGAAQVVGGQGQPVGAAAQTYVLGPGDVVEVDVLGRSDFKTRTRIRSDGTVVLPFIGVTRASSLSAQELSNQVAAALRSGGIFADPIVSVEIVSYASQYVTVLGAVTSPGLVPVDRAYRVSEILARVGGKRTEGADYIVLRPQDGPEQRLKIEALATGGPEQDPIVPPGAKLFLPEAELFFIYGQVNEPGAYPMMSEMTLRKALARGGGVALTGSQRRVKLFRGQEEVRVSDLDMPIQPGDVIRVRERLF